jgi:hypothetical protein
MRLVAVAIQIFILSVSLFAADPLSPYVDASALATLRAGGSLTASVAAAGALKLLPAMAARERIAASAGALQPTLAVEILRLLPSATGPLDTADGWLKLYNALHAVSTMKGLPYYSTTRRKTVVLFTESYAVDSAETLRRIPDPVFTSIPADNMLVTVQDDSSFGKNTYRETFWQGTDHVEVRIENLTRISLLFFPFAEPGALVTQVALVPAGNDVLFYGMAGLRTTMPIGDRRSREESLANRLSAMADWLKTRLAK